VRFTSLAVTKSQIPYSFCVKLHLLRKGNQQARFIPKVTMVRFPLLRLLTGSLLGIPAAFFLLPRLIGLLIYVHITGRSLRRVRSMKIARRQKHNSE